MLKQGPILIAFCLALILILPAPGRSQSHTLLTGKIDDENGQPVPGVEVVLHLPGADSRTFTDAIGSFRFDDLPSGNASLDLMKTDFFRVKDFPVSLAEPSTAIAVTLTHEFETHSDVQVVSTPSDIEPQETPHEEELVAHEIREDPAPSSHNLVDELPAIPGVVQDNDGTLHVAGGRSEDTLYVLDGFEINNPASGIFDARINVDSVRDIAVNSGRFGAQYPNAAASVLSLHTDTGDDHWRFGTTNFLPTAGFQGGFHLGDWFPRFTFSGPIQKGRLWFSDGLSLQHAFSLITQLPPGSNTSQQWAGDNLLRLQYNLTPKQSLQANFLVNGSSTTNSGIGALTPESTTTNMSLQRYLISAKDQISFARGLLEIGVAADTDRTVQTPHGSETYILTPAGPQGNYFEQVFQNSRRLQQRSDLTLANRHWHGQHDLQFGINFDWTQLNQTASRHSVEIEQSDSALARQSSFIGSPTLSVSNNQTGGYAQDAWQLRPSLILQSSLRLDWNSFIRQALPQPRFVLNWIPEAAAKFSVGWGLYYQPVQLTLISEAFDQQRIDTIFNNDGTAEAPLITSFLLSQSMRQPYFDTVSAEWQERWNAQTTSSIHVMQRLQHNGLVYDNISGAPPQNNLQLDDSRRDRYDSIDFQVRHSFRDNANAMIDYTYSQARSNKIFDFAPDNLLLANQSSGPLSWDAPQRVISRGAVQTDWWKLLFSYFAEYHTGFPFSAVNAQDQVVDAANGFRYPPYFNLSVGAEKRFPLYGYQWAFRLSSINATEHHNFNSVINNVSAPNFMTFEGGEGRAFTARIRLVGRK